MYGLSPVCSRLCVVRLDLAAKDAPHSSQTKGRSPVWVRMCSARLAPHANDFPQFGHTTRSAVPFRTRGLDTVLDGRCISIEVPSLASMTGAGLSEDFRGGVAEFAVS